VGTDHFKNVRFPSVTLYIVGTSSPFDTTYQLQVLPDLQTEHLPEYQVVSQVSHSLEIIKLGGTNKE